MNANGTLASGTPNVSVVWQSPGSGYEITIAGHNYTATGYTTIVTPRGYDSPLLAVVEGFGDGKVFVQIWRLLPSIAAVQSNFQFVTYRR